MKTDNAVQYTTGEWREAIRPLASLIAKSQKAQQKLAPETWQHAMLRENLAALHIALELIEETGGAFAKDALRKALPALASMIGKTEKALAKFAPGTSQHTLQQNRLKALTVAEALIKGRLDEMNA